MNQHTLSKEEQEERERLQKEDIEKIRAEMKREKDEQQILDSAKKNDALGGQDEPRQQDASKPLVSNPGESDKK